MTDQQHKDMLRLQATLEYLTISVVGQISAQRQADGKPHPDVYTSVKTSIDTLFQRLCAERGLQ